MTSLDGFQGVQFLELLQLQEDTDLQHVIYYSTLKLRIEHMGTGKETLQCNTSTDSDRPIVPFHTMGESTAYQSHYY